MAEIKDGDILLDPFCGGGTIPIEAAQTWNGKIRIFSSDISTRFLEGAKRNAKAAGVEKNITFRIADARRLEEFYGSNVDKIVTNPPYEVRIEIGKNLRKIYFEFLNSASEIIKPNAEL